VGCPYKDDELCC
jgi:hypothetical protein